MVTYCWTVRSFRFTQNCPQILASNIIHETLIDSSVHESVGRTQGEQCPALSWVWVTERLKQIANNDLVGCWILIYEVSGSYAQNLYTWSAHRGDTRIFGFVAIFARLAKDDPSMIKIKKQTSLCCIYAIICNIIVTIFSQNFAFVFSNISSLDNRCISAPI